MKQILLILLIICFSCSNEKVIQLPEISHSEITEIIDVSAAYLFYDVTKKDSVELNRKNLISTTNWLINVDKRLTLKQVIPHIKFLQDKKGNSSHKNQNSKNYFTCNDTSRKNLGFIEFTNVVYTEDDLISFSIDIEKVTSFLKVYNLENIKIQSTDGGDITTNSKGLLNILKTILFSKEVDRNIILAFEENLSFQEYISIKSILSQLETKNAIFSNEEYILN